MSALKQTTSLEAQVTTVNWSTIFAVTATISLGLLIIVGVGFAAPEALHNAAHDVRHTLAFPCH